ncbi:MAG: aldehyde dehydrogenase family protein [Planctomycetota bacterium]|nr:MAG: aldehyde dehydrogenase family protein [Planctomycetota bacterium]
MKKLFIGGEWVAGAGNAVLPVICPSTGEVYDEVTRGTPQDIDCAVDAAAQALRGQWGRTTALQRGRWLTELSQEILKHRAELSQIEARDTGKPLTTAHNDVTILARYFEFYGAAADKVSGEVIPFESDYLVTLLREPLGITAHIIPWNYPAQMIGRSIAPALAMGNATVLKPAEDTCLSALYVADLAREIGLPDGAFNVVTGLGEEAGAALAQNSNIDFISFTGSNEVGTKIQAACARRPVKCVLELGGKSPQIVFADANIERAIPIILRAIVQNAGQTCTAGSRLLVQRSIYEGFVERIAQDFKKLQTGSYDMDLDCGPLMNGTQQLRVTNYIQEAKDSDIPVLAEGSIHPDAPKSGFYVAPIMFGPVEITAAIAREEVFGPVLSVIPFEDEQDAIRIANSTDYGLVAGIWTENGARQHRVARGIRAGQVFINSYGAGGGVELPFGGTKRSGHGREKGLLALEEVSSYKTLVNYYGE